MNKTQLRERLTEIARNGNRLEADVARDWKKALPDYEDGTGWIADLMRGGCASGFVGKLVYTSDARKYYDKYYYEIEELISEIEEEIGEKVESLNKDGMDRKNFLAWLGYEETARRIAYKIGVEI
mgnify:CR=1 FL=1